MREETWFDRLRDRWEAFELFAIDVVYGRQTGPMARALAVVLRTFSWLFNCIVRARTYLYRKRILHDRPLGCLVVVVGNLTVGGTGKTPVVEAFARSLAQRGRRVAILSRGYGSRRESSLKQFWRWLTHQPPKPPKVVSDGETVFLDADVAGDEPVMLARNLPGVAVLVDKNRVKAGEFAIKKFGADVLLLDDGFQYLPLRGQLNLLMIDKGNPFGNRYLLPRGILREPIAHLRRASYVFLTKSDGKPDKALEATILKHKPGIEIIECTHEPRFLQAVFGEERCFLEAMHGARVAAFSGIATPESFEGFLTKYGASIVHKHRFLDHHRFNRHELERFYHAAQQSGAQMILTTEKDAVRVQPKWAPKELPFYYLRLEVKLLRGAADFESAISRICYPKKAIKPTRSPFLNQGRVD